MRLLKDRHLRANHQFVETDVPEVGKVDYFGLPFKSSAHEFSTTGWSAQLGQHNHEVYSSLLGLTDMQIEDLE